MHSIFSRINNVSALLSSCMMALLAAITVSTFVFTANPKGDLAIASVKVLVIVKLSIRVLCLPVQLCKLAQNLRPVLTESHIYAFPDSLRMHGITLIASKSLHSSTLTSAPVCSTITPKMRCKLIYPCTPLFYHSTSDVAPPIGSRPHATLQLEH